MGDADYRKLNDGSHSSSTYHKKDGTPVRAILRRETEKLASESEAYETYEYAGFLYRVRPDGENVVMLTVPGQHSAASKIKHRLAAAECYLQDKKAGKV